VYFVPGLRTLSILEARAPETYGIRRSPTRRWWKAALAALVLSGLAALGALRFPQQLLCVDAGSVRADAIVVLGGGIEDRAAHAAKLYRDQAAAKVIVSGASGTLQVRNVKMRFRDVIAGLDVGLDVYDLMGLVTVQAQGVKKSLRLVH